MRIISGSRRGHKLIEFEGESIRPTTDRVKESIFNLIQPWIAGARVLDLFAGSGALAFEALSRGAESAVCVDRDKSARAVVKENCRGLCFEDNVDIVASDSLEYLGKTDKQFDLIFLDPPYNKGFVRPVLERIRENNLLSDSGVMVLESDSTDDHEDADGFEILKQRRYGRTYITVYKKKKKG